MPTCPEPDTLLPGFYNASFSFIVQHVLHKEPHICFHWQRKITHRAGPPCALREIFHLVGFMRAIFQFTHQTYGLIQRSLKSTERLLLTSIGFGSCCSGKQGTVVFIIRPWAKNRLAHMTRLSPHSHSHPPPASTGHGFAATGRCLHHGPTDTGQSSRKPSKS